MIYPSCSCMHNVNLGSLGKNGKMNKYMKGGTSNWSTNRVAKRDSNPLPESRAGR